MAIDNFQIPLILGLIIFIVGAVGSFIAGVVPKSLGYRQAIIWFFLVTASIAFMFGYGFLALEEPEFDRSADNVHVVYGEYAMTFVSHTAVAAMLSLSCFTHMRHILPPPVIVALMHATMAGGTLMADFGHWLAVIFVWVLTVVLAVVLLVPHFGQGSANQASVKAHKGSSYYKRMAFCGIFIVAEVLAVIFWMLEPAIWGILDRLVTNVAFLIINIFVGVFGFLIFWIFKPDTDPEVIGRGSTGPVASDEEAAAAEGDGNTSPEDEEQLLPAEDEAKKEAGMGSNRRANGMVVNAKGTLQA